MNFIRLLQLIISIICFFYSTVIYHSIVSIFIKESHPYFSYSVPLKKTISTDFVPRIAPICTFVNSAIAAKRHTFPLAVVAFPSGSQQYSPVFRSYQATHPRASTQSQFLLPRSAPVSSFKNTAFVVSFVKVAHSR